MINNLQLNKNENDVCVVLALMPTNLRLSQISLSQGETTQFVVIGLTLQDSLLLYITTTFYVQL
jgi:hypothetical protein